MLADPDPKTRTTLSAGDEHAAPMIPAHRLSTDGLGLSTALRSAVTLINPVRLVQSKFQEYQRRFSALFDIKEEITIKLSSEERDKHILRYLRERFLGVQLRSGAAVLVLPDNPTDYCKGRPKQALRTNRTKANALGLQVRRVTPDEFDLLAKAIRSDHEMAYVAKLIKEPIKSYMETWVGSTSDGATIAFARFAIGSNCVRLKYFAAIQDRELSIIRWKMAADIFESFAARGIRYVVAGSVLEPTDGLAYYQNRHGFVRCRINIQNTP